MSSLTFPLTFPLTAGDHPTASLTSWLQLQGYYFSFLPNLSFTNPIQTSLVPLWNNGSGTPAFTRASTAYQTDFEILQHQVLSGEARFQGARVVQNLLVGTESFLPYSSGSADNTWNGYTFATITPGQVNPNGGTNAAKIVWTAGASSDAGFRLTGIIKGAYRFTLTAWLLSGTQTIRLASTDTTTWATASVSSTITLTTSPQRISLLIDTTAMTLTAGKIDVTIGGEGKTPFNMSGIADVYISYPSVTNVTGQTNQNPSEYVSVGVLSAPYHGAGVDGIQYFNYLNGNTVASNVVTQAQGAAINSSNAKWAVLPGVAGSYFSTPSATANQITGDLDIRIIGAPVSWTDGALQHVPIGKWTVAANQRSYFMDISGAGGAPRLFWSTLGSDTVFATSTAVPSFAAGTKGSVRATLDVDNGAGGYDVKFYTSVDLGATWTQLGTTVTGGAPTSIYAGSANVLVGASDTGNSGNFNGNIYRAQIYNGINGTLAVDFNPNNMSSGTTWASSTTGETWTQNGSATVYGVGVPSYWDAKGPYGYLAEGARTNLFLQSQALATTSTSTNITAGNNDAGTTAPDGTTTATLLTATAGNGTTLQSITGTAASYTFSVWLKRQTGTGTVNITVNGGTTYVAAAVTTSWQQFTTTQTLTVAGYNSGIQIVTNGDAVWAWGAQTELGAFASTYIPTTTTALARNADVNQYVSAGNIAATMSGTIQVVPEQTFGTFTGYIFSTYVDSNNSTSVLFDGTNLIARKRIGGTNHDATIAWTPTANTVAKVGFRFDGANGCDIWLNGAKGTNNSTTTAAQIGTNFQIGADGNSANQDNCMHRFFNAYPTSLSDAKMGALTT